MPHPAHTRQHDALDHKVLLHHQVAQRVRLELQAQVGTAERQPASDGKQAPEQNPPCVGARMSQASTLTTSPRHPRDAAHGASYEMLVVGPV